MVVVPGEPRPCTRCHQTKPASEFYASSNTRWCKTCSVEYQREYQSRKRNRRESRIDGALPDAPIPLELPPLAVLQGKVAPSDAPEPDGGEATQQQISEMLDGIRRKADRESAAKVARLMRECTHEPQHEDTRP